MSGGLVIYGLIAWSLAVGYFPRVLPDTTALTHWATGLVAALLLFVSVFLHDLSDALVALRHGLGGLVHHAHIFGGVSQLDDEPRSPGEELWMAIIGPLTSFTIALVAGLAARAAETAPVPAAILGYLASSTRSLAPSTWCRGFLSTAAACCGLCCGR